MSKARDLADFISTGSILSDGTIESTEINGVTADASELNVLDGITVTTEELNNVAGISTSVQTQLDGKQDVVAGVSDTEIGYLDGVTSSLQTQLDNISVTSGSLTKSFTSGETASITLAQAISPAPVVSVTKEVPQVGVSSKGTWDVNASASNYELHNTAYNTTLTTGAILSLGTGSFASTDVGKRIQGNGGDVILTSTAGAYDTTSGSAFTDSSTIASGSWTMRGLKSAGDADGITIPSLLSSSYDVAGSSSTADATYVPSGPSGHKGFTWKSDGTKFYVVGDNNREVYEFPVTTPYDISTASSSTAVTTVVTAQTLQPNGVIFNNSGTQFAIADNQNNRVVVFTMSTAWDITTASQTWNSAGGYGTPTAMLLASNGSILWVANESNGTFYKHPLSTANDFTTMSYDSGTAVDVGQYGPAGIWGAAFNGDGTKVFIVDDSADKIWSFDLSTAYDFTTIQSPTTVKTLSAVAWRSINFSADGTKMHIMRESGTTIEQYNVGSFLAPTAQYHIAATNSGGQIDTAFWTDLNTMVADQSANDGTVHYAVSTDDRTTWSVIKEGSGVRPIVRNNAGTWEYNSSATYGIVTWTAATTNEELYALQQSLTDQAQNRMDKTQLDAVTDPNHFTLGNTLDLAIALRMDTASSSTPTADGVTINYDAASLNQGAVLGTDYDYDFPDSTTVRVTSNAAQNLKIRVVQHCSVSLRSFHLIMLGHRVATNCFSIVTTTVGYLRTVRGTIGCTE